MLKLLRGFVTFLTRHPHVTVVLLILITFVGFVTVTRYYAEEARRQAAFDTAKTFEESISTLHQYFSREIVPRAQAAGVEFDLNYQDTADKLPYPARLAMDFGAELRNVNPRLDTSLYSKWPFPNRRDRVLDQFEAESLTFLSENPFKEFYRIEISDGYEIIRYARAILMKQTCVDCHNRREYGFSDVWKVGDFRGARQVSMPVPNLAPIVDAATTSAIVLGVISSGLVALLVWPVVRRLHASLGESEKLALMLDEKNRALEEAGRVKSQFLAGISHDFRNPMAAILGFSTILREGAGNVDVNEEGRSYAKRIYDSGSHLQGMIDQLLEISQIESNGWELVEENITPISFMSYMRAPLEHTLGPSGMSLECHPDSGNPVLWADRRAVMRIVANLIENSAKYSKGTKALISFESDEEGRITLAVSDDGQGIDPARRNTVLSFGDTEGATETASNASYGIGLWSVQTLAQTHDASVRIDTAPVLGGCRVSITFPSERTITL